MRWPHPVGSSRIRPWLDRLEAITALGIGVLNGEALKVGIEGRRVRVTRVGVAPMGIGLPQLDPRAIDWLPVNVHNSAHRIDDLAGGAAWFARSRSQIGGLLHRAEDGIKRSENFAWSPFQRLREHRTDRPGHREAAGGDRHPQNVPS